MLLLRRWPQLNLNVKKFMAVPLFYDWVVTIKFGSGLVATRSKNHHSMRPLIQATIFGFASMSDPE